MLVMMVMGLLAAIAIPNFIRQAGKAREVEFKNTVGSINRAQQVYHWEKETFASAASDAQALNLLNISFQTKYINSYNIVATPTYATVAPQNLDYIIYQTRGYSGGTFYGAGAYRIIICQGYEPDDSITPPTTPGVCTSDGQELK